VTSSFVARRINNRTFCKKNKKHKTLRGFQHFKKNFKVVEPLMPNLFSFHIVDII
jgi:hypothetical protein